MTVRLITGTDDYRGMTQRDLAMARRISGVAREMGIPADPTSVQTLLVVPGAPAGVEVVRFWQALLGYERRADSPDDDLVDPLGRNVPFWFEMMDEPRADGGGAIHVAVWVPPEQAEARVAAALAAGGRLVRRRVRSRVVDARRCSRERGRRRDDEGARLGAVSREVPRCRLGSLPASSPGCSA